ncbi:MAG: MBL fold metallo-hydrolase [Desulfuromonadaceae bacterium]|nr:MBL fold metallo-hydrolase [Desulfuromonadaceae bacterium]
MSLEIVQIKSLSGGNFSYLVFCPRSREGMIIDPSFAAEELLARAAEKNLRVLLVANTHGHRDHTEGNRRIMAASGALLAASPLDLPQPDIPLAEGSVLKLGEETIHVLHTPGHSPGSLCFLLPPGDLVTGDTLFVTKAGRADLPGGNPRELYASLKRLAALPESTRIHPGHDYGPSPVSTIAFEKEHNPYLRCADVEEFIRLRMG